MAQKYHNGEASLPLGDVDLFGVIMQMHVHTGKAEVNVGV